MSWITRDTMKRLASSGRPVSSTCLRLLLLLDELADSEGIVNMRGPQLAERLGCNTPFLSRLLSRLYDGGVLVKMHGPGDATCVRFGGAS